MLGRSRLRAWLLAAASVAALSFASSASAATTVNLAEAGATVFRLPLYIALKNGDFAAEGIELQIVETRSGSDGMKMLAGRSIDFDVGQLIDAAQLTKQGITVHGIAMLTNRLTNSIQIRKDLAGQIKTMHDLKGRTLGITGVGSGTWQFALFVAAQEGMKGEDFNLISTGPGAGVIGAMKSKRIDALSYSEPESLQLLHDGDAEYLVDMGDPATHRRMIGEEYMDDWIMATPEYAKTHVELTQHLVNALQRALNWLDSRPVAEVSALLRTTPYFSGIDPKILEESIARTGIPKTTVVTKGAYDAAMKIPVTVGALEQAVPFDQLVDNSFAEKAASAFPPKKP